MRKISFVFLFILALYLTGSSQRKVHLSVTNLPSHTYIQKMDQMSNTEIEFIVDSSEMKQMPNGGKPIKKTSSMHLEMETKTGKLIKDSLFMEKMVITSFSTSQGASPIPSGTILYGTGTTSGRTTMDSISSDSMDAGLKEKLLPLMQKLFSQVSVPEHTIKVGDSFSYQLPFSFPIPGAGMNLDFVINTTYKLKNVSNDIAYFDLEQTYTMNSESVSMPLKASGSGNGTMTYDINNRTPTRYELNNVMKMSMAVEGKSMKMKVESTTIQQIKIGAN